MQPNNNRNNADNQFTPVMDIQRPSSVPPAQPTPRSNPYNATQQPTAEINTRPATMEYTRPRPGGPANNVAAQFNSNPVMQAGMQPAPMSEQKKSKKGLVIALFLATLFLIVGGGGFYYYVAVAKKSPVADQQTAPVVDEKPTENTSKIEATPEGVDKVITDLDQQMNSLDDAQDFNANDVSDDSIGVR